MIQPSFVSELSKLAIVAVVYHLSAFIALHVLEPQLSPISGIISDYSSTDSKWLVVSTFLAFGAIWAILALALSWPAQGWWLLAGRVLFALAAVGLVLGAIVPSAADPRTPTALATILNFVARPGLLVGIVIASLYLRGDPRWSDLSPKLVLLASAAFLLTLVSVTILLQAGFAGLGQRAVFIILYVWVGLVSTRIISLAGMTSETEAAPSAEMH
jgi:Protein of unknown function (DUF998)